MKNLEIELRFLVRKGSWNQYEFAAIEQRYLSIHPEHAVRVRIKGNEAMLTIKGKRQNDMNAEFEWPIELEKAREMFDNSSLFEGAPVKKKRYTIEEKSFSWKGKHLCWEVDEFLNQNDPLLIAEIELRDVANFEEVSELTNLILDNLPEWVGDRLDTNTDPSCVRYGNMNLARSPFSQWSTPDKEQMLRHLQPM